MKISIIDQSWRCITLAGFMGCIFLVFCLHCSTNNNKNHLNFQTTYIPPIEPLHHESITSINDTEKPALSSKCTVASVEKPAAANGSITSIDTQIPAPVNESITFLDTKKPEPNESITLIDGGIPAPVNESITFLDTKKSEPAANEPIFFSDDTDKPALFDDSSITSIDTEIPEPAANEPIVFSEDTGKPAPFKEPIITSIDTEKPAQANESIASPDTEQKPTPAKEPITSSTDDTKKPAVFNESISSTSNNFGNSSNVKTEEPALEEEEEEECNIFDGKWVYNPEKSPLYSVLQCPFLGDQVSCQMHGRPDREYEKWSWEPEGCEIPRFNATEMLERLRNKRVIIVGDSINRNQWESLACLLYSAIRTSRAYVDVRSSAYKVFKAMDYQCSVEFYWSPFLVQLQDPDPASGKKVLRLDKLAKSARKWRGANVMLFNTGPWWVHPWQMRKWELFQVGGKLVDNMELEFAFERALKTWSNWVDRNVDTAKTQVFFRSMSAEHSKRDHFCYKQTQPILTDVDDKTRQFPRKIIDIVERTIGGMRTPVKYLNITQLSGYRIDGHPSIYTKKKQLMLRKRQIQPETDGDCSHWCLPGVPDTWNTLLYASLV